MSKQSSAVLAVVEDGVVSSSPKPDGHRRRRSWTPAQKLKYLAEYESAVETGQGAAYLRREGLYSSLMSEWRRQRDAGLLEGKQPGQVVGRPSREQTENARLRAQLRRVEAERDMAQTALDIMGKARALLEQISESADTEPRRGKR
jgi:transposase-like protein